LAARSPPPGLGARPAAGHLTDPVIVAVVVVVSLLLVGTVVGVFVLLPGTTSIPPPEFRPIGSAFAVGGATEAACSAPSTFATNGCAAGHSGYTMMVEASTVTFQDVAFEVLTAAGDVSHESEGLGFTVFNASGVVLAQFAVSNGLMSMGSATWTYSSDTTPSTPLTYYDYIGIDMGMNDPAGQGLVFVVMGVGQYTGTVSSVLP